MINVLRARQPHVRHTRLLQCSWSPSSVELRALSVSSCNTAPVVGVAQHTTPQPLPTLTIAHLNTHYLVDGRACSNIHLRVTVVHYQWWHYDTVYWHTTQHTTWHMQCNTHCTDSSLVRLGSAPIHWMISGLDTRVCAKQRQAAVCIGVLLQLMWAWLRHVTWTAGEFKWVFKALYISFIHRVCSQSSNTPGNTAATVLRLNTSIWSKHLWDWKFGPLLQWL